MSDDQPVPVLRRIASVIHPSHDLETDRAFWRTALGVEPYFDQPFYVGFRIGELEIGLDPDAAAEGLTSPVAYWEVDDIAAATTALLPDGTTAAEEVRDVGDGTLLTTVRDASGNAVGLLQRPAR